MSFLDAICSAMGAVIVLAVVFSAIRYPVPTPIEDQFIVMKATIRKTDSCPGVIVKNSRNVFACKLARDWGLLGSVDGSEIFGMYGVEDDGSEGNIHVLVRIIEPSAGDWMVGLYPYDFDDLEFRYMDVSEYSLWTREGQVEIKSQQSDVKLEGSGYEYTNAPTLTIN